MKLESTAKEGKSPVNETSSSSVESRVRRDTRNPDGISEDHLVRLNTIMWPIEYSTVRERWKEPREGSEKEPETVCLQADKAPHECDVVLFVERAGELRCVARLSDKVTEPKRERVLIVRISSMS